MTDKAGATYRGEEGRAVSCMAFSVGGPDARRNSSSVVLLSIEGWALHHSDATWPGSVYVKNVKGTNKALPTNPALQRARIRE